ncbi:hypothetical protein DCCM_4646 [Desulfocucumis palustris]|uniref:Uncharacterized protein n=1 Tax=Desulfocucumis palustris TaxID=1898651 RepID=A0A2L2XGM5_9FIRM|nr:hypothetical protein DCCM_4646 [Desulfocucumis palustris]
MRQTGFKFTQMLIMLFDSPPEKQFLQYGIYFRAKKALALSAKGLPF